MFHTTLVPVSRSNPYRVIWPELVDPPVCYTIFTSRKTWGVEDSEINIENFKEQAHCRSCGFWITPGNFLLFSITLNINLI